MNENLLDHRLQNRNIKKSLADSITEMFPIKQGSRELSITNINVEDTLSETDFPAQKETKLRRKNWEMPITANIEIFDTDLNKVVSKKENVKIGAIPKITNRFSAIIKGNEYQVTNQIRRKSGVYSRVRKNGELESEFNLQKGANFSIEIDPQKQIFYLTLSSSNRRYRLYNVLDALGVSDAELEKAWGSNLVDINKKGALNVQESELKDIYRKVTKKDWDGPLLKLKKALKDYFSTTKMSSEVTKITLGSAYDSASPDSMIAAAQKLVKINKGEQEPDDRDSLIFKNIYTPDDLLKEYFKGHAAPLQKKLSNALRVREDVREIIPANTFSKPIESFFTTSDLSSTPPQTNPVAMAVNSRKTTPMGEGGIQNSHSITMETRDVHPSQIGFLDPLSTPESDKVGVTVGLTSEVQKIDGVMKIPVIMPNGEKTFKSTMEMYESVVGLPDQFKTVNGKPVPHKDIVKVMNRHKPGKVNKSEVDFYIKSPNTLFDFTPNLMPWLQTTQANRASTGSRMITQALPIDNPDTPLSVVQRDEAREGDKGNTYEDLMGSYLLPSLERETGDPEMGGTVTSIEDDYVNIKGDDGKDYKIGMYKDFPLNEDGFLNTEPVVEKGQRIEGNELLAKSNYTDKEGRLAMGKNLTVGYISYKGNSFEDAATITESAAKKLTHTSVDRLNVFFHPKSSVFNLKKFRATFPEDISPANARKLDSEGLPKVGETFDPGETLVAFLVKKEADDLDMALKKLNKATYSPYSRSVLEWDEGDPGVVTEVRKVGRNIDVYVKSVHPFKEGDKLSSRYGDKHIIGKIIPDDEAPHRPDGTPVDIMVNPQGVQGRMNMGQMLDTTAGKIALKKGEPFVTKNFSNPDGDDAKDLYEKLKAEGIEANEILTDGKNGEPIENPVFVGNRQYMKLRHLVKKKNASHSYGVYDIDEQPAGKGAQRMDVLSTYAHMAHGANNLLRESSEIKGRKNEEYFRNLQFGLPPSKPNSNLMFDKLINYVKASGADVKKDGHRLQLASMTDDKIEAMSKGEIPDPGAMLIGKNLGSRKGGLFDPEITGGQRGENYSHIDLPSRLPNPMAETAIKSILGLTNKKFEAVMKGSDDLDGKKGPEAIVGALSAIDVSKELKNTKDELNSAPESSVNKLNLKARVLKNLDQEGLTADKAFTNQKFLLIPPKFRPVYPLPSGDLQVSDINKHYRDVGLKVRGLKTAKEQNLLTPEEETRYESNLYDTIKSSQGFTDPQTYGKQKYKGALKDLGDLKKGLIFGKAWSKRQDLSGRSTITPEPSLGLDDVGIPEDMAYDIFEPFTVRKLKQSGMTAMKAKKEVKDRTKLSRTTLEQVMREKPVVLNRAPSLHKHSVQAFKPSLTSGKEIRLNPMVVSGYGADFDGDQQINSVVIFLLDKDLENYYISHSQYNQQFWRNREIMASRLDVKLPYVKDGKYYMVNLEDFPYKKDQLLGKKDHIDFYEAEEHINVVSYDEVNKKLVLAKASGWSYHKQREIWTVDLSDKTQIITDDDPRAIYGIDPNTLKMVRSTPSNAKKLLVPKSDFATKLDSGMKKLSVPGVGKLRQDITLSKEVGYVLGSLVGDGWVDVVKGSPKTVNLAGIEQNCFKKYKESLLHIFKEEPHIGHTIMKKSYGKSEKRIISSVDFASWVLPLIGKGAKNKHLPPFWFTATDEFKWGLFSGLLDTDGSVSVSRSKKKPQMLVNISSISIRLLQETQQLLRTLGIRSRISFSKKTQSDNDFWILSISAPNLSKHRDKLFTAHEKNIEALGTFVDQNSKSAMRNDYVPFNAEIKKYVNSTTPGFYKTHKGIYESMNQASKVGYITRFTAKQILDLEGVSVSKLPKEWVDIVKNEDVTWVHIKKVENTGKKEDGYDLTVPGYETFLSVDGIVLSNTMSVMVPVTYEGEEEARSIMPSRILFKHGDHGLVPSLSQEYIFGVSKISEFGRETGKSFNSIEEAKKAKLRMTDVFKLNGKKMTIGQWELNKTLPEEYRDYSRTFKRKDLPKLLTKIAKEQDSKVFAEVIDNFKNLGASYSYKYGGTLSIDDMVIDRSYRDDLINKYEGRIEKLKDPDKKVEAYNELVSKIEDAQNKSLAGKNRMLELIDTGALSATKAGNVRQVLSAPGIVTDTQGRSLPLPILRSYSEGLDTFDYTNTYSGVRKGTVDKSVNTRESGALNKILLSATRRLLVTEEDCGTSDGRKFSIDDKNVMDRTLTHTVPGVGQRNTLVDSSVILKAREKDIKELSVRSPLSCESVQGVCQKCYGALPDGKLAKVGTNVGLLEAQSLTERSCNHMFSIILAKKDGEERLTTLSGLWEEFKDLPLISGKLTPDDPEITYTKDLRNQNIEIFDGEGFTKLNRIGRHKPSAEVVAVKNRDGAFTVCQKNHPLPVYKNNHICESCGRKLFPSRVRKEYHKCEYCKHENPLKENFSSQWEKLSPQSISPQNYGVKGNFKAPETLFRNSKEYDLELEPYTLGIYLAEGCIHYGRKRDKTPRVAGISISQQNTEFLEGLMEKNSSLNFILTENKVIRLNDTELGKRYGKLFGRYSHNKHLPDYFVNWDDEVLSSVFAGIIDGDGCCHGNTLFISSNSFYLMQQLQLLANHFDLTTNLQIDHDNGIMGHQGMKLYLSGDFTFLKNKSDKIKKHFDDLIQISKSEANVDRVSEVTHIKGFKYVPEYVYDVETESGKAQLGTMVSKNTQLTMQTFHTGGAAKKGGTDIQGSFPRILELVKVPEKLSGKATLSSKDGKVESVEQNEIGGYDVKVGGTNFIIGPGRTPVVEKGNNVKKGDRLSDGKIKPQELAEFKDFASAQDYIVDGISDVYGGDYFKKGMETVVRGISDNAEITYAPENSGLLRGDKKSTSYIKSVNRERASQDLEPIGFKPYFKSVDTLNVDNEDWGTRITTNRIKDGLAKGMARGDWANLAGKDPVLPFLYGDDFGRPERKIKDGTKGFY